MSKIIVMGDVCIDIDYHGEIKRISPEAPIPIFNVLSRQKRGGMAHNVVENLEQSGNKVVLLSNEFLFLPVTKKHRYFSGQSYLYRIDEDEVHNLKVLDQAAILIELHMQLKDTSAVILQDYNKGFFSEEFIQEIVKAIRDNNPNIHIIADGNKARDLSFYKGVDYLKVNEEEYEAVCSKYDRCNIFRHKQHEVPFLKKGILLTKGERGATLIKQNGEYDQDSIANPIDVTGAGDTFVAWWTHGLLDGLTEEQALQLACVAASISTEYIGCYAPTAEAVNKKIAQAFGVYT